MSGRFAVSIMLGCVLAVGSHFYVKSRLVSDILIDCPNSADCASKPYSISSGWPMMTREAIVDFRDTTDDFRRSSSLEIIPLNFASERVISDSHFISRANINLVTYSSGFVINAIFFSLMSLIPVYILTYKISKRKI